MYYQGTVCTEVEKAQLHGLDPQYKSVSSVGFAVVAGIANGHSPKHEALAYKNAKSPYFVTKLKKINDAGLDATTYVNIAYASSHEGSTPKLIGALLPKDEVSLEDDP